ncbi:hypothetical protein EVAR_54958_1 [Eumeta japonica]|uniref:Uncharacterized protein n=1 Tax=Eumeta variegata TaxID=151549 RepID=A0A4C1YIQ9_EUMVA|nr:hypothetical protein EVAR_54958_1 [Eumeta japonica]
MCTHTWPSRKANKPDVELRGEVFIWKLFRREAELPTRLTIRIAELFWIWSREKWKEDFKRKCDRMAGREMRCGAVPTH